MKNFFFLSAVCCCVFFITSCSDYEKEGDEAYKKEHYLDAAQYYRKAQEEGNADATAKLAKMYDEGIGVKQDSGEARRLIKEAKRLKEKEEKSK